MKRNVVAVNRALPSEDFDDKPEWTEEDFARAGPAGEVLPPEVVAAWMRKFGMINSPAKRPVSLRLGPDVLDNFRASGSGWQSRINQALHRAIGG